MVYGLLKLFIWVKYYYISAQHKKRSAIYTKEEKPRDKTTYHKLGEVDFH